MREIKFRAWDKEYKNWREIPDLYGDYQANAYRTYGEPFSIFAFFNTDAQEKLKSGEIIVQQFTGFKDKNGKEIYEGDFIQPKGDPYIYEIVWDRWGWGIDSHGIVSDFIQDFTAPVQERAIIIGNIFENPIDK